MAKRRGSLWPLLCCLLLLFVRLTATTEVAIDNEFVKSLSSELQTSATANDELELIKLKPFNALRLRPLNETTGDSRSQTVNKMEKSDGDDKSKETNGTRLDSCEFWLDGNAGNMTSLGHPEAYPNHLDCRYRVARLSRDVCRLELRFEMFDLAARGDEVEEALADVETGVEDVMEVEENEFNAKRKKRSRRQRGLGGECQTADYLEFANGPKRYCGHWWQGRREIVELTQGDSQFLFRFRSNYQQSSKGFSIGYRPLRNSCPTNTPKIPKASKMSRTQEVLASLPASASGCEQRHTEMEFRIKSANFPNANYSHNQDCIYYVIKATDEVCGLELRFHRFHLEESEACAYDYLEVDGESFCGRLPNDSRNIFRFADDVKTISFQTDGQVAAQGFDIGVRQLTDCANTFMPTESRLISGHIRTHKCGIVRRDQSGQVTSLRYPEPYPKDALCAYTIERAKGRRDREFCSLELEFITFDLQDTPDCRTDFLELENQRFCGRALNGTRRLIRFSDDGFVKFLFKSDVIESENVGFAINYTQVECVQATIGNEIDLKEGENESQYVALGGGKSRVHQLDSSGDIAASAASNVTPRPFVSHNLSIFYREPCYELFTDKKFALKSEIVNGTYRENLDCLYAVRKSSPNVCYIEMEFIKFDLEASAECQYDYVEIGNAVRLCGTLQRETSRIYVFEKDEFFITFHTDASAEREGFLINAEQLECKGDRIVRNDNFDVNVPVDEEQEARRKRTGDEPRDNLQSLEQSKHESRQEQHQQQEIDGQQQQEIDSQQQQQHQQPDEIVDKNDQDPEGQEKIIQQPQQGLQQQESISSEFDLLQDHVSHLPASSLACSTVHQEREFFITTPGFPSGYPPDLDCLHMIRPYIPTVCKLEINFDTFELQPYDFTKDCAKSDFLDIDGREQTCGKMPEARSKLYPFLNETFVLHFHADAFRTSFDKGFRLFVRQIDCGTVGFGIAQKTNPNIAGPVATIPRVYSRCNKLFTTATFEVKSLHYPSYFPSDSSCQYRVTKIRRGGAICFLEVAFVNFELQDSYNCTRDFVNFNGIKVCGTVVKDSVRLFPFYGDEFVIHFSSDRVINGRFHLFARQAECSEGGAGSFASGVGGSGQLAIQEEQEEKQQRKGFPERTNFATSFRPPYAEHKDLFSSLAIFQTNQRCQQILNTMNFELESPNYPSYYLPSLGCVYTVQRRHSRICKLELAFLDFDIEPSVRCLRDYLQIDGTKYCNTNRPETILQLPFYEPEKIIAFQSVSFRRRKGFHVRARQMECEPYSKPTWLLEEELNSGRHNDKKVIILPSLPSICEICVTEVTGAIQSYDYPNYYPPNVNCSYKITPLPGNCMLQIRFDEFDFDVSSACDLDFLEVNGVRYCGSQLRGVSMMLANKRKEDLTIRMITNSRGALLKPSFRGFRASYTQLPCLAPESDEVPRLSSPASSSSKVNSGGSKTILAPTRQQIQQLRLNASSSLGGSSGEEPTIYCDQKFDTKIFTIESPGYPYRYYDAIDCLYRITKASPSVCRLKLTFQQFNVVGEDGLCRGDYLEVFGERICGVLERFTTKEVPFLRHQMTMQFHTNRARTANGFHIVGEQVDCLAFGESSPKGSDSLPREGATKTNQHQHQQQQELRYDDDEAMMSGGEDHEKTTTTTTTSMMVTMTPSTTTASMPSTTASSTTTTGSTKFIRPMTMMTTTEPSKVVDITSRVDYSDTATTAMPLTTESPPSGGGGERSKTSSNGKGFPLRYYSHNITVVNRAKDRKDQSNEPFGQQMITSWDSKDEQQHQQQQQQQMDNDHQMTIGSGICDEPLIEKMYFELKGSDLKTSGNHQVAAGCQLRIRKAKAAICQLDIMFVRYNLDESTCGQQYLSVDGERICGHVPPSTIKKFWFIRSELLLFVKLAHPEDRTFEVKVRQVECAGNVEQKREQQQSMSSPHSMIEQKQDTFDQPAQKPIEFEYSPTQIAQQQKVDSNYYDQQRRGNGASGREDLPNHRPQERPEMQQQQLEYDRAGQQMEASPRSPTISRDKVRPTFPRKGHQFSMSIKGDEKENPAQAFVKSMTPEGLNRYCDLIESEISFKLTSPRDQGPHRCRYTIRKASEAVCALDIRFEMFRLADDGGKCENEFMDIDSGKICGAFPIGHERRYHFLPNEYEKLVYFNSSRAQGNGDFRLEVKQIEDCQKPLAPKKPTLVTPTICERNFHNTQGRIQSPNYPAPYSEFTRCTYRLRAASDAYCRVRLLVTDLDIEGGVPETQQATKECAKDVLEFGGHKLCGQMAGNEREFELPFEMINGQKMVQLMFSSDGTSNGRGFDIEYRQEACSTPSVSETSRPVPFGGAKGWRGNTAIRLVSPTNGLKGMVGKFKATASDNSLNANNPMRPHYPPNYVSKAHLTKSMDRKQFIKLFMMMGEKEVRKIPVEEEQGQKKIDTSDRFLTSSTTTMASKIITPPTTTTMATTSTIEPKITTMMTMTEVPLMMSYEKPSKTMSDDLLEVTTIGVVEKPNTEMTIE